MPASKQITPGCLRRLQKYSAFNNFSKTFIKNNGFCTLGQHMCLGIKIKSKQESKTLFIQHDVTGGSTMCGTINKLPQILQPQNYTDTVKVKQ